MLHRRERDGDVVTHHLQQPLVVLVERSPLLLPFLAEPTRFAARPLPSPPLPPQPRCLCARPQGPSPPPLFTSCTTATTRPCSSTTGPVSAECVVKPVTPSASTDKRGMGRTVGDVGHRAGGRDVADDAASKGRRTTASSILFRCSPASTARVCRSPRSTDAAAQPRRCDPRPLRSNTAVNSFSSLAFSAACGSMSRRLRRPRQHPVTTPQTLPAVDVIRVTHVLLRGEHRLREARAQDRLDGAPKSTPLVSLKIWPTAAAARERPNATPTLLSMASPA